MFSPENLWRREREPDEVQASVGGSGRPVSPPSHLRPTQRPAIQTHEKASHCQLKGRINQKNLKKNYISRSIYAYLESKYLHENT